MSASSFKRWLYCTGGQGTQDTSANILFQDEDETQQQVQRPPVKPIKPLPPGSILAGPEKAPKKKPKRKFTRDQLRSGQTFLTQQAWTNRFDSQAGTRGFGAVRHGVDIKADDLNAQGNTEVILQSGTNKFDSQKGTRGFGAVRHVADIRADDIDRAGQADVILQAGSNRFDSQAGTRGFGAVRHVADIKVTEIYDEEFEEGDDY